MCRVAAGHDLADGFSLLETPGWATLLAILQESGERPPKRPSPFSQFPGETSVDPIDLTADEQLAKRFKFTSLR